MSFHLNADGQYSEDSHERGWCDSEASMAGGEENQ
jgi:hypothetical protein